MSALNGDCPSLWGYDAFSLEEKWDKMDDFLEVMFTMACTAKHGKDVGVASIGSLLRPKCFSAWAVFDTLSAKYPPETVCAQ